MKLEKDQIIPHLCKTIDSPEMQILVIPESLFEEAVKSDKLDDYEVPVSYSYFKKRESRIYRGHIICDVKYDETLGIIEDEPDEKEKYYQKGRATGKKYELVKEDSITVEGRKLYRIRALDYIGEPLKPILGALLADLHNQFVNPGELGGYIESESNLDQSGNSWVYDTSMVYGNAKVLDDAVVGGDSVISDDAVVKHHAVVIDNCKVRGKAVICRGGKVKIDSVVEGNCEIDWGAVVEQSVVKGNVYAGSATWIYQSQLDGNIEILRDSKKENDNRVQLDGDKLSGSVTIKNSDAYIFNSEIEDTVIKNVTQLEFSHVKMHDCTISDCKDVYSSDYEFNGVEIQNMEYYDSDDLDD